MRITESRLVQLALWALEEASAEALYAPVRHSTGLRLALAYLASRQDCERWPFDQLWQSLPTVKDHDRTGSVIASMNGIYRQLGIKRCSQLSSRMQHIAKQRRDALKQKE